MSSCVAQHDDSNVHQQAPQIHIKPNGIRNLAASLRVWKPARALTRLTSVPARELGRSLADRCSTSGTRTKCTSSAIAHTRTLFDSWPLRYIYIQIQKVIIRDKSEHERASRVHFYVILDKRTCSIRLWPYRDRTTPSPSR